MMFAMLQSLWRVTEVVVPSFDRPQKCPAVLQGFPRIVQRDEYSCGLCAVRAVLLWYKIPAPVAKLRKQLNTDRDGTSQPMMIAVLKKYGLNVKLKKKVNLDGIREHIVDKQGPAIVSVDGDHVAVVHGVRGNHVYISDPAMGREPRLRCTKMEFHARYDGDAILVSAGE